MKVVFQNISMFPLATGRLLSLLLIAGVALRLSSAVPSLTKPTPGTSFTSTTPTFTWSAGGTTVSAWNLQIGSSQNATDYYLGKNLSSSTTSLKLGTKLPSNAHKAYVRLRYLSSSVWYNLDYTFFLLGTNNAPNITGNPSKTATVGTEYVFTPAATDVDGETLRFSIVNQPNWTTFNIATGKLSGTPVKAITNPNITIAVRDERNATKALASFSITVSAAPTKAPTRKPTSKPVTKAPTRKPTAKPVTKAPTRKPTAKPVTKAPTRKPTSKPVTKAPTRKPTSKPVTKAPTNKPTPQPTNSTIKSTITVQVIDGNDDVEELLSTGTLYRTSTDLELVYDGGLQAVGIRYQNVSIPQGATILDARIQFITDETTSATVSLTINGDATDHSPVFSGDLAVSSRPKTNASVLWSPPAWSTVGQAADAQRTPNIASIVQEIVSRQAWKVGNAMSFMVFSNNTNKRVAGAFESNTAPKLTVSFEYNDKPPVIVSVPNNLLVSRNEVVGQTIGKAVAYDPEGSKATFSLLGGPPFTIDSQNGDIKVSATLSANATYNFQVLVSDAGGLSAKRNVTISVASAASVDAAVSAGDASITSTTDLLNEAIGQAQTELNYCKSELAKVYPNGLVKSAFPTRSAYMLSSSSRNLPVHAAHYSGEILVYSWMGNRVDGTRYAMLGTHVFQFVPQITELASSTLNLINWLLKRNATTSSLLNETLVVLAPDDKSALTSWLSTNNYTNRWTITTNTSLLTSGKYDLYFADIRRNVTYFQQSFAAGKPVLAFNQWYEPPDNALAEFGLAWDWYGGINISDFASVDRLCEETSGGILSTLTTLRNGVPNFVYEEADCPDYVGVIKCNTTKVTDSTGKSAEDLFFGGAETIREQLSTLDASGVDLFSLDSSYRITKLAVLLGDKYRQHITYPMDKVKTDDNTFYRALFADYTVCYGRSKNDYQPDMGDFTDAQAALNAASTGSASRTYTPTIFDEWTSTGLYAPPGKPITIRRTDSTANVVKVKFNFIRETTRLWNTDSYSRPRYVRSPEITLAVGKNYTLSTPYGGPIYVYWQGVATGATSFSLDFAGVRDNPILRNFDDTSIQAFSTDIFTTLSDWVDIKTPYAEIHSLKSYMIEAFGMQDGDASNGYTSSDVQSYISDINVYLIAGNYEYAGYSGVKLADLNAEVSTFCSSLGLTSINYGGSVRDLCRDDIIHAKPKIQHINADIHSVAGALTSGNPFDSGSPIEPVGWGESHEMGHNLQRDRLDIYNGRSSEVSNNIFSLHTQWRWTVDHNLTKHPTAARPYNAEAFAMLQSAIASNTTASINHPLWSASEMYDNASERLAFYMQLVYTQQSWDLYTKLYIMERIFTDALATDSKWTTVKDLLGFGTYTRTEADAISGNDFMLIATSKIAMKSYTNYFRAWGVEVSQKATDQVTALGITTSVPLLFYYVNNEIPAAMPGLADTILLDGKNTWKDPTP